MSAFGGLSGSMEHHSNKARTLAADASEAAHKAVMNSGKSGDAKALARMIRAASKATVLYGQAIAHADEANDRDLALALQRDANGLWSEVIHGYITMKE